MRKRIICVFICILMFAGTMLPITTASSEQRVTTGFSETQKESIFGNKPRAFLIGFFNASWWEEDRCVLFTRGLSGSVPHDLPVMFITRFGFHQLGPDGQIQLIDPQFCFIGKNFVIGFSQILFPESTISMHVISHNDDFNRVNWVVDNIEGDKVWGSNLHAVLYLQNGQKYIDGSYSGPYKPSYLNIGDEFYVTTNFDGFYQVQLVDWITGRVLFTSPYMHF
jgi:hypothetical protein